MSASEAPGESVIRTLLPRDLDRWHALQSQALPDAYDKTSLEAELTSPRSRYWGAEHNSRIVGVLLAWRVLDELQVLQIVVAPRRRRLGVASALMKRAIDETRISEGTSITLEVRAGNSAAIGLYQALGFERDGLRRDLYPDGEDGVLMRLHL